MTWVVAASTIYGYGALYSDVQVTYPDGTTRDVLQKAYPVANFMAGGFAGSVKIGFMLMQSLIDHLKAPAGYAKTHALDPVAAALSWEPIAQSVFATADAGERKLESRILLVGTSPIENLGLGAKVYFVRLASPDFKPQFMTRAIKICGIGTGAAVREYKHGIKPLFRFTSGLYKAEIGRAGGWGEQLGFAISHTLGLSPRAGISRHLNTILIARQGFLFGNTDRITYQADGSKVEHKMPAIARNYREFLAMSKASGVQGAGAVC
jgi:hypothetical protein